MIISIPIFIDEKVKTQKLSALLSIISYEERKLNFLNLFSFHNIRLNLPKYVIRRDMLMKLNEIIFMAILLPMKSK